MNDPRIHISVVTRYLPDQSSPAESRYGFTYTITIHNQSTEPVQLISRHWIIIDSAQGRREVRGEGVIGQQPIIAGGENFTYTSGVLLDSPVGTMEGSYLMHDVDGREFTAPIAPFLLALPGSIN